MLIVGVVELREIVTAIPNIVDHGLKSVSISIDEYGLPFFLLGSDRNILKELRQVGPLDRTQELLADHNRVGTSDVQLER